MDPLNDELIRTLRLRHKPTETNLSEASFLLGVKSLVDAQQRRGRRLTNGLVVLVVGSLIWAWVGVNETLLFTEPGGQHGRTVDAYIDDESFAEELIALHVSFGDAAASYDVNEGLDNEWTLADDEEQMKADLPEDLIAIYELIDGVEL